MTAVQVPVFSRDVIIKTIKEYLSAELAASEMAADPPLGDPAENLADRIIRALAKQDLYILKAKALTVRAQGTQGKERS